MVIVGGTLFAIAHPSLEHDRDDLGHHLYELQAKDHGDFDDSDYLEYSSDFRSRRYREMIHVDDFLVCVRQKERSLALSMSFWNPHDSQAAFPNGTDRSFWSGTILVSQPWIWNQEQALTKL